MRTLCGNDNRRDEPEDDSSETTVRGVLSTTPLSKTQHGGCNGKKKVRKSQVFFKS
jgi:hypothetical protein